MRIAGRQHPACHHTHLHARPEPPHILLTPIEGEGDYTSARACQSQSPITERYELLGCYAAND